MTTDHSLEEKIRSCVLEIVDAAPPAPVLELDQLGPGAHPRWTQRRTVVVLGGLVVAISVIVAATLLVAGSGSSQEVSEALLKSATHEPGQHYSTLSRPDRSLLRPAISPTIPGS